MPTIGQENLMRKNLLIVVFLVFCVELLLIADKLMAAKWPEKLEMASGTLSVKAVGRDEYLEIKNEQNKIVLSCSLGISGTTRCFSEEQLQQLSGKMVIVQWYRQSSYGGARQNKLVSLEESGKQFRDLKRTKYLDNSKLRTSIVVGSACVAGLLLLVLLITRKQGSRHGFANP
ncbi:hypothetical protein LT707_24735 [Pseudomonas syringae pv. syringae]|nr:hypothetical protein [Pseudomonas syringae pv. syringae]